MVASQETVTSVRGVLDRFPRFIATVPGRGYRFIPTFSNAGWAGGPVEGEPPPH